CGARAGRAPARPPGGPGGVLWGPPPPRLWGVARHGVGGAPLFWGGVGGSPHATNDPATPCAHPCRRAAPTLAVWRRVRCLLRPDSTADSWALLARRAQALAQPRPHRWGLVEPAKPTMPA